MKNEENSNVKIREEFLDVISGIMVGWMILGHIFQWSHLTDCKVYTTLSHVLFMFMAWFFFKGGMFAKERVTKEEIKNWGRRLLIPFVAFSAIGMVFYWIKLFLVGDRLWIHYVLSPIKDFILCGSFPGNLPLWFLFSLFVVRLLFGVLANRKYADWWVSALLVALYLIRYEDIFHVGTFINYPYYIYNIILGLVFYWVGYRVKNIQYSPYAVIISIVALILTTFESSFCDFRSGNVQGDFLLFVLSATAACIIVNNVFRILCEKIKFRLLSHIGKQSMYYFCMHWIFLMIIQIVVVLPLDITVNERMFIIYIVGLTIMLPISNSIFLKKSNGLL